MVFLRKGYLMGELTVTFSNHASENFQTPFDTTENAEFSIEEERWKGGKKKDPAHNPP